MGNLKNQDLPASAATSRPNQELARMLAGEYINNKLI